MLDTQHVRLQRRWCRLLRELNTAGCYGQPCATFWPTVWISLVGLGNAKQIAIEKAFDGRSVEWLRRLSLVRDGEREKECMKPSWMR